MPTSEPPAEKTLQQVVEDLALYPLDAFRFVQEGLQYTAQSVHGANLVDKPEHHINGQQLCEGLRRYALSQWGLLARTVLRRWNITCTYDFGRIVFALIEAGRMSRTDEDTIEDFRNVFDFKTAFEVDYQIEQKP